MAKIDPKVTALLLGMPKGESSSDDGGEEEDADVGESRKIDAADAVLKAMAAKDPKALSDALSEHYKACESGEEDES
jgi:DNA-binding GntR family transcriptional regulator